MPKDRIGVATDCQGKQPFPSKQAIFKIFSRPGREKPEAYKCKICGFYHIAHKKKHYADRKMLGRYLDIGDKIKKRKLCTMT